MERKTCWVVLRSPSCWDHLHPLNVTINSIGRNKFENRLTKPQLLFLKFLHPTASCASRTRSITSARFLTDFLRHVMQASVKRISFNIWLALALLHIQGDSGGWVPRLGWHFTVRLFLPGRGELGMIGWLGSCARCWNIQISDNRTQVNDHQGHPVKRSR